MNGSTIEAGYALPAVPAGWEAEVNDVNGDASHDILWHHQDGQTVAWEMNGSAVEAGYYLPTLPVGWNLVG
jgi:hypothetical protein